MATAMTMATTTTATTTFISVDSLAKLAHVSRRHILRLLDEGGLPLEPVRFHSDRGLEKFFFIRAEAEEWAKRREVEAGSGVGSWVEVEAADDL